MRVPLFQSFVWYARSRRAFGDNEQHRGVQAAPCPVAVSGSGVISIPYLFEFVKITILSNMGGLITRFGKHPRG